MFFKRTYSVMGEIMKKLMDKLFSVDKKIVIFLFIISFIGIITGALYMTVLSNPDKTLVHDTLISFLENVEPSNYVEALRGNLILNLLMVAVIWLLGFSVVGLPIIIFLLFYKSFVISFSLSSFIANYGLKGTLIGFLYQFPHQLIMLIVYLYLGCYALRVSFLLVESIIRRKNLDFKLIMNRYLLVLIVSLITIVLMTLFETFITPYLLKNVINML